MQLIIKKCFSFSKLDVINLSVISVYVPYCAIGSNLKKTTIISLDLED